ncbi:hypothetical protein ACFHW2_34645 [Actinomadura sp. LOL_016]|uniref:hypothetical protein n=1 Tax=unclassified Actinomadura TaxID=2626254 RepID=UPI003A7FA5C3
MTHELNAVLGKHELLERLASEHGVPVVALGQGFALIPLTPEVIALLVGDSGPDASGGGLSRGRRLDEVFQDWSAHGPVVHATNDTHGGSPGEQTARIWQGGKMVFAQRGHAHGGPISMALQRLGVTGGRIGYDEFDVVGLGRHRKTAGWLDAPGQRTSGHEPGRSRPTPGGSGTSATTNAADRQIPEYLDHVGAGWHGILKRTHAELLDVLPNYQVAQVKEKWGMLDVNLGVYFDPVTGQFGVGRELGTRISDILQAARDESRRTCEVCGEPGTGTDRGWIKTLCPDHGGPG